MLAQYMRGPDFIPKSEKQKSEPKPGMVTCLESQITRRLRQEGHKLKDSQRYIEP